MEARASEPITVIYGRGRESLMNLTMNGQSQLEKGDFAAAQRGLDAVIKADPTFYPAYYIRAEVFLDQRKYEAIQDWNEALRKDSTFAEGLCAPSGVALRFHASGKRTECPLGAQAGGRCSPAGTARIRFGLSAK
jgi:tetratricopeptide (TPR) repeat protein